MRIANRLIATLLALALVLFGLLVLAESISGLTDNGTLLVPWDTWLADLQARPWTDVWVRLVAAGLIVLGLLFLVAAGSAKDRRLALRSERPDVVLTMSAPALARSLRQHGESVPGVAGVNVSVTPKRALVNAHAPLQDPQAVHDGLSRELGSVLSRLPWRREPTLRVNVRGTERRSR